MSNTYAVALYELMMMFVSYRHIPLKGGTSKNARKSWADIMEEEEEEEERNRNQVITPHQQQEQVSDSEDVVEAQEDIHIDTACNKEEAHDDNDDQNSQPYLKPRTEITDTSIDCEGSGVECLEEGGKNRRPRIEETENKDPGFFRHQLWVYVFRNVKRYARLLLSM